MNAEDISKKILEIEEEMLSPSFWSDKDRAQAMIRELQELKDAREGVDVYDRGGAIMTILTGAGGDDAEDFSRMLFAMYQKFFERKGWQWQVIYSNENSHGGYRSLTLEISAKNSYKDLKHENGVHRLVRISPFNAQDKRQTSFSMVEIIPLIEKQGDITFQPDEIEIEFTRSGGPGGQNVNKRETAVRVTHIPSGITVRADGERGQDANRDKALQILKGKVLAVLRDTEEKNTANLKLSSVQKIEWGNQIRSYILHPYKMVKDHRTEVEIHDVDRVLERGMIEELWG